MDDLELCDWAGLVARAGSARRARTWLRQGLCWRVLRGVYASHLLLDGPEVRARAVRLALPPGTALSGRSALWLLGVDALDGPLDVTAPREHRVVARPGLRVHTADLPDDELCVVDGLLVVSAARALLDLARREPRAEAVALGDAVLRSGVATEACLRAALDRSVGLRGVRRARLAVEQLDGRSESPMESRLRLCFRDGGLHVEVQVDLYDDRGHVARVDLRVEGVLVEYDGRDAHLSPEAFVRERRRQGRLLEAGAVLRRYTAQDVYGRSPADLCAEVVRAAAGLGPTRLRPGADTLRPPARWPLPTLDRLRRAA